MCFACSIPPERDHYVEVTVSWENDCKEVQRDLCLFCRHDTQETAAAVKGAQKKDQDVFYLFHTA